MQFSLQIICTHSSIDTIMQKVTELTDYLDIFGNYHFVPYWKHEGCNLLEISAVIENPDYAQIKQYILWICESDILFSSNSAENWECSHFASIDRLLCGDDTAFVVCNIYDIP